MCVCPPENGESVCQKCCLRVCRVHPPAQNAKNSFSCIKIGSHLWLLWLQMQDLQKNGCSKKDVILVRPMKPGAEPRTD